MAYGKMTPMCLEALHASRYAERVENIGGVPDGQMVEAQCVRQMDTSCSETLGGLAVGSGRNR